MDLQTIDKNKKNRIMLNIFLKTTSCPRKEKMTPELSDGGRIPGLEGETSDPWQKAKELLDLLQERPKGKLTFENPNNIIAFYALLDSNGFKMSLYDVIRYRHSLYKGKKGACSSTLFAEPLMLHLTLDSSAYITTEVRSRRDLRRLSLRFYNADKCYRLGYSSIPCEDYYEDIEVSSREAMERMPFDREMPQQIDFGATMGEICDIASRIVRSGEVKPEDVEALKAAVFGPVPKKEETTP